LFPKPPWFLTNKTSELLAIEHALQRREAQWARRRLVAEQLHRAKRLSSAKARTGA
jgi:hypothetical protein